MASIVEPEKLTLKIDRKQEASVDNPEFLYRIVKQAVQWNSPVLWTGS